MRGSRRGPRPCEAGTKSGRLFVANDLVALDDRRDADARLPTLRTPLDAHNLAHGADENLRAAGNLRRERQGDIELGPGVEIVIDREVDTASRDVARLAVALCSLFFYRRSNDDRQRQIVTPCHT